MTTNREKGYLWLIKDKTDIAAFPSPEIFESYIKAVLICANGDGKVSPRERGWVVSHFAALGAPDALLDELNSYDADEDIEKTISATPVTDVSRYFLIYDAIRACSADEAFSDSERATVVRMAAKLGVPAEVVRQIEELVIEETQLREKRLKLLYPNGAPM
ncbi:MAG: hypothetical protein HC936_15020 [Leptolyngbyaceae cyanobacterium SU_3_3]|nr:hypothetical protein [Leptolyngbyaceae cyanobacterium SU_3_3]